MSESEESWGNSTTRMLGVRTTGTRDAFMELHLADRRGKHFLEEFPSAYETITKVCPHVHRRGPCLCVTRPGNVGITPAVLSLMHDDVPAAQAFVRTGVEPAREIVSCGSLLRYSALTGAHSFFEWLLVDDETAAYRTRELVCAAPTHGQTALHLCCERDQKSQVKQLLKLGADLNAVDEDGFTPLMVACSAGALKSVKVLMKAYAALGAEAIAAALMYENPRGEKVICHAALPNKAQAVRSALISLLVDYQYKVDEQYRVTTFGPSCRRNRHECLAFMCGNDGRQTPGLPACYEMCNGPDAEEIPSTTAEAMLEAKALGSSCAQCDKVGTHRSCDKCRIVVYCSRDCQKLHWKKHKRECAKLSMEKVQTVQEMPLSRFAACGVCDPVDSAEPVIDLASVD